MSATLSSLSQTPAMSTPAARNTVADEEYGMLIRSLDWACWGAEKMMLPIGKLDVDSIVASSERTAGLNDWGDPGWRPRLQTAIDAGKNAPLTSFARVLLRQIIIKSAVNRLQITEHVKKHPEVLDVEVKRPIFVLGFPRTGTTLLQNLLQLDPDRRALQFWELTHPVPTLDDPVKDVAARLAVSKREVDIAYMVAPEMGDVHFLSPTTAEECWALFNNSFAVMNWDLQSGLTDYGEWLMKQDMVQPYREYKQYLQALLLQRPAENLVLKCPEHLWNLDALLEVFPDACIVWTHRDPLDSIASYCSLISLSWRMWYGKFHPHDIGEHITERFLGGVNRALAVRDKVGDDQFYDTNFDVVVRDPGRVVREICDKFDLRGVPEADIETYLNNKRQDKRGKHVYSHDRYGLDAKQIHEQYAHYISRFKINTRMKDKAPTPIAPPMRPPG